MSPPAARLPGSLQNHGLIYSGLVFLARAPAFLFLPVYAHQLPPAQMGWLVNAWIAMAFLQTIGSLGAPAALFRFFPASADAVEKRAILSSSLAATLAGAGTLCGLGGAWYFLASSGETGGAWWLPPAAAGFLLLASFLGNQTSLIFSLYQSDRRPGLYARAMLQGMAVEVAITGWLAWRHQLSITTILGIECAKQAAMALPALWSLRRQLEWPRGAATLRRLLGYGIWLLPAAFLDWIIFFQDRFWLERLAGLEEVGIYGLFLRLVTPFGVLCAGYITSLDAHLFKARPEQAAELFRNSLRRFLWQAGAMAALLAFALPPLLHFFSARWSLFPPVYARGLGLIPLFCASLFLYHLCNHLGSWLDLEYRSRQRFLFMAAAAVSAFPLIRTLVLTGQAGGWGAATGAALGAIATFALLLLALAIRMRRTYGREHVIVFGGVVALLAGAIWKTLYIG